MSTSIIIHCEHSSSEFSCCVIGQCVDSSRYNFSNHIEVKYSFDYDDQEDEEIIFKEFIFHCDKCFIKYQDILYPGLKSECLLH